MSLYLENNIKIIPNVDWLNFHHTNKEIITIINLYKLDLAESSIGNWCCKIVNIGELFEIPKFKKIYYLKIDENNYTKKNFKKNKIKISVENSKFFGIFNNSKNIKNRYYKYKVYIYLK